MDILDILLAKKKSFTGETEKLTRQANEAMAKANEVVTKIDQAEEALTAAQEAQNAAETANSQAQELIEDLTNIKEDLTSAAGEIVDEKVAAATASLQSSINEAVTEVTVEDENTSTYKSKKAKVRKKGITNSYNIMKNYTSTGSNEDGSMTQKAITNALVNQKTELTNKINNIQISGGSGNVNGNLSDAEPGSLVIVDDNGNITSSDTTETDIIKTQIIVGTYTAKNTVGLEIDYENKTFTRIQEAATLTAGEDFDKYPMFGGRRRCIVNDNGEILAFYGDANYIEDGSLGQVMDYQPKFYYLKVPLKTAQTINQTEIYKEVIIISVTAQSGFNIHPLFLDKNGNEIDYVLLPAYEGCAYNPTTGVYNLNDAQTVDFATEYLSSIGGAKPISGSSQHFTLEAAEQMAKNRGEGWYLTDLTVESANQILMSIEYGSLNIQKAFNKGITTLVDQGFINVSCITGSTSELGARSGMASSTTQTYGNTTSVFNVEGKCAISYRGMENPYGNIWRFVDGVKIVKESGSKAHLVYKDRQGNTHTFASIIPTDSSWISHFGHDSQMSWALIPTSCKGANSSLPVGDYTYVNPNLTGENCCVIGGKQSSGEYAGPFYYGMDYDINTYAHSYSGRIMHVPTAGTAVYLTNIEKWKTEVGGE